jgi:hypothetical protein
MEASSSDSPPDKKVMPGTAGGTVRSRVRMVYSAIFSFDTYKKKGGDDDELGMAVVMKQRDSEHR